MLKPRDRVSKRQELREDTLVTVYARALQIYEDYKNYLIGGGVLVVLLVAGLIGYNYYIGQQNTQASELLGQVVRLYEQGQYTQALEGTGEHPGLLEIVDRFGHTSQGNLARYYAAESFFHLGNYERALEFFQEYEKQDNYLGASAYAGMAAAHEQLQEHAEAAQYFERAANVYQNPATSPHYLVRAARNYEEAGNLEEALETYRMIKQQYPDAPQAQEVTVQVARLESRVQSSS